MRRDLVVAALAVVALVGVSLLGNHDAKPQAATHASGDYSFGGYRAWYALLEREGTRVERFRRHHDALRDSGIDTLVVAFADQRLPHLWNAAERDALRRWVRNGGRLVDIGITPAVDKNDGKGELVYGDETHGGGGPLNGTWASLVRDVPQRGDERMIAAKGARVETLLRDRAGIFAVRYRYGRGEVIGLASAAPFENRAIGSGDNARLAFLAARPGRPGGTVAFDETVRGDIVEKPWYRALSAPELLALAFAALAGVLWLAYGILPLGPAVRLRAPREPTSEEFVDAVAALYARAGARDHARDALLRDARGSLERAARTPENATLARRVEAAKYEVLSDDAGLIGVAQLARSAREETVRAASPERRFASPARGIGARRRRR
ncbi:MAG: hypothetical protein JWO66_912 [Candidatus Eremiobacteraeota bacterium]|nr:hypothetical protein [Candidatus Eremiobacteraeota bacterium]